jgi:hypothetical protein
MALALNDRVQQTGTANTTVSFTLSGAVTGFQSFAVVGNGNTTYYSAFDVSGNWEVGIGTYSTTGPTLTRTTILSSSNSGSAVTFSGTVNVFVTYPSGKSVNLDGSGNVSPLGTIASGVWNGSTIPVAYGGTGVTASSGASSVVLRDANQNIFFNNYVAGAAVTTAAAGTTVLTVASARSQLLVGSTTQTYQLPDATTLTLGHSFIFINNSSGFLTVVNNASATIETIPSGGISQLGAVSIATSAGSWGIYSFLPGTYNFNTTSADFGNAIISNTTYQGTAVASGYGGTGLTTFTAANNALYSTSSSALAAGTLPIAAGGTAQTSFTNNYIHYGSFSTSVNFQFDGSTMRVGTATPIGGATNPIVAATGSANGYIQSYIYNSQNGTSSSSDFAAYPSNGSDASGWVDLGITSLNYSDVLYPTTGPNEGYLFMSAPSGSSTTGNLVYATDSTGTQNYHQWYVGGFAQAKSAWKMQLTSTGLQLSNALGIAYGGTGETTANGALNALLPNQATNNGKVLSTDGSNTSWISAGGSGTVTSVAMTVPSFLSVSGTPITAAGTLAVSLSTTPTVGQLLIGNGTGFTYATLTAGTGISITNGSGSISIDASGVSLGSVVTTAQGWNMV